jgi:cell wall-associated NlpC family hydrolase
MKLSRRLLAFAVAVVMMFTMLPLRSFAKGPIMYGIGFTTGSDLRLRKAASTKSEILDVSPKNEVVVVLGRSGDWYHVIYNLTEGYMHKNYVSVQTTQNAELGYGKINGTDVNVRSGPGTNYTSVTKGNTGDKVYILGISGGWYKVLVGDDVCYIRSDYVDLTEIPYENEKSGKEPLFYKGGKSTGLTPSAEALKNHETGEKPEETTPPTEEPTTPPTEETVPPTTEPPKEEEKPTEPAEPEKPEENVDDGLMDGIAFVTATHLFLRSAPSTDSTIVGGAPTNDVVVVISKHGDWYKVVHNLKEGYMHGDYLKFYAKGNSELGYGKITGYGVNLRSGPSTDDDVITTGTKGNTAYIIGIENGWYRVIFGNDICYIRSDFLALTQYPYENQASPNSPLFYRGNKSTGTEPSAEALRGSNGSGNEGGNASGLTGQQVVDFAKKFLGIPYKWGGTTPAGFDCSGFVYYVYNSLGYKMPRMIDDMNKQGRYVAKSELKPGDVIIFQNTYASGLSHVGIYVGDGKFIHSPNSRSVVSYADLYSNYYINHYYGARRICEN